jgi:hypothetical protein
VYGEDVLVLVWLHRDCRRMETKVVQEDDTASYLSKVCHE